MTTATDLAPLVTRARCILLDFDGPVCAVFAGLPAPVVAQELRRVLTDHGISLPEPILTETDPLEIIRYSATIDRPDLARLVDDVLRANERDAVRSAAPTPYAREVILTAHQTGRRVAVVSNNSAEAVRAYLDAHRLIAYVDPVIGRAYADPAQMKPNPAPVRAALAALDTTPADCVLIGDSPSDIHAAHGAAVPVIGYANKPGKHARLADADTIITTMADLATSLTSDQR